MLTWEGENITAEAVLQRKKAACPVQGSMVGPSAFTPLWLLRDGWVAEVSLCRAMTSEAFCHLYDTPAVGLFEFVVYIVDSLSDQIQHFNEMLLLMLE